MSPSRLNYVLKVSSFLIKRRNKKLSAKLTGVWKRALEAYWSKALLIRFQDSKYLLGQDCTSVKRDDLLGNGSLGVFDATINGSIFTAGDGPVYLGQIRFLKGLLRLADGQGKKRVIFEIIKKFPGAVCLRSRPSSATAVEEKRGAQPIVLELWNAVPFHGAMRTVRGFSWSN